MDDGVGILVGIGLIILIVVAVFMKIGSDWKALDQARYDLDATRSALVTSQVEATRIRSAELAAPTQTPMIIQVEVTRVVEVTPVPLAAADVATAPDTAQAGPISPIAIVVIGVVLFAAIGMTTFFKDFWYRSYRQADRAAAGGRLAEALTLYTREGNETAVEQALQRSLPDWPVKNSLIEASAELFKLQKATPIALHVGVAEGTVSELNQSAKGATEALWKTAERLVAVDAQGVTSSRLQERVLFEDAKVKELVAATQRAREILAHQTLGGRGSEELEKIARKLKHFGEGLEEVSELGE